MAACLVANLNSFVFDFVARQFVAGANVSDYITQQLAVLPPWIYKQAASWAPGQTLGGWLCPRALELIYNAWDLEPFAHDLGYDGPPFRWNPERRFLIRCELDAAFFHLYGIERDDADYIMDTFRVFKPRDEATHGEYRTKRVILEIYDQMAYAGESGRPYRTLLDPPPVELDLLLAGEPTPATVTPLLPHEKLPYLQLEESRSASVAAEEKSSYGELINTDTNNSAHKQPRNPTDTTREGKDSSHLQSDRRGDADEPVPDLRSDTPPEATLFPDNEIETKNTIPSMEEAALALYACVPEGEKVQRDELLLDAARELGHTQLTRKVRRALNKSLNAEHNAGRLKTDWELVWKPRKK